MKRRSRLLLRLSVSVLVGLLLLELGLRGLLFGEGEFVTRLGTPLRQELLFADARNEDDCWKLRTRFGDERSFWPHPNFDRELGWRRFDFEPETCAHPNEDQLDGRRPVLFYGDSFTECATERDACWESLLARSELGERFVMLNFGTGGYGLGQMLILMRRTLDRYAPRADYDDSNRPIVIVGLLVDDDLDRTTLSLRNFPKPRFRLPDEGLVFDPPAADPAVFLEENPIEIRSYLWRYLLFGSGIVPDRVRWVLMGEEASRDEKRALNRALIEAMQAEIDARGLDSFFVIFHGPSSIWTRASHSWQEPFLYETFEELGIPFVSSKRALMEAFDRAQDHPHDYFLHEGKGKNHYNVRGNEAAFAALVDGLEGRFEPLDYLAGAPVHPRDRN